WVYAVRSCHWAARRHHSAGKRLERHAERGMARATGGATWLIYYRSREVIWAYKMSRRMAWQKVLDAEVTRWSAMSCGQLVAELHEVQAYEVEFESQPYQVEVELLE